MMDQIGLIYNTLLSPFGKKRPNMTSRKNITIEKYMLEVINPDHLIYCDTELINIINKTKNAPPIIR